MPSSYNMYAIDYNKDGKKDLFNEKEAIASVENYFSKRGNWKKDLPVAYKVKSNVKRVTILNGYKTRYKLSYLKNHLKIKTNLRKNKIYSLIKLDRKNKDEIWLGTSNFKAIAKYNPREYYVSAVNQLALAIKQKM